MSFLCLAYPSFLSPSIPPICFYISPDVILLSASVLIFPLPTLFCWLLFLSFTTSTYRCLCLYQILLCLPLISHVLILHVLVVLPKHCMLPLFLSHLSWCLLLCLSYLYLPPHPPWLLYSPPHNHCLFLYMFFSAYLPLPLLLFSPAPNHCMSCLALFFIFSSLPTPFSLPF